MENNFNARCSAAVLLFVGWSVLQSWGQTEYIQNGGFESGDTGWVMEGTPFGGIADNTPRRARSGSFFAWFGGALNEADACYQLKTIPSDAASANPAFYFKIILSGNRS